MPFALLSYGVLAFLGFGRAVAATIGAGGPVGSLVADATGLLGAGVVWLAAYKPTIRGVRAVRDIDLSTTTAAIRMARYVVGVSVAAAVVMLPLRAGSGVSPLGLVGVVVLPFVVICTSPWVLAALRSTISPGGSARDRLAALRDRAGLDVRDTLVLDTGDEETAAAYVRGPPGYRRLFVTTTFRPVRRRDGHSPARGAGGSRPSAPPRPAGRHRRPRRDTDCRGGNRRG
ncbi:MAG: hypothetical protein ABEH58_05225 [Haloplanus sp.]